MGKTGQTKRKGKTPLISTKKNKKIKEESGTTHHDSVGQKKNGRGGAANEKGKKEKVREKGSQTERT